MGFRSALEFGGLPVVARAEGVVCDIDDASAALTSAVAVREDSLEVVDFRVRRLQHLAQIIA